jgi:hypothetical protein
MLPENIAEIFKRIRKQRGTTCSVQPGTCRLVSAIPAAEVRTQMRPYRGHDQPVGASAVAPDEPKNDTTCVSAVIKKLSYI